MRRRNPMNEKDLEHRLAAILRRAQDDPRLLNSLPITSSMSGRASLYDLIGDQPFDLFQDTSEWNPKPRLMVDVSGGITPDLVIRSRASKQNRIYIEVKLHEEIRDVAPLSQVVRQFLHLLAMSQFAPLGDRSDIKRALLLAAPSGWFGNPRNWAKWQYLLEHYADLAALPKIDITLGEMRLDFLI
jgi:hypothetical protein